MAYRPKIKNANGTLTDLPIAAETAVKADDYNTATGTIKNKFSAIDNSLANLGKLLIGSTYYVIRETTYTFDEGVNGAITVITED